jgi:hypothetical protein
MIINYYSLCTCYVGVKYHHKRQCNYFCNNFTILCAEFLYILCDNFIPETVMPDVNKDLFNTGLCLWSEEISTFLIPFIWKLYIFQWHIRIVNPVSRHAEFVVMGMQEVHVVQKMIQQLAPSNFQLLLNKPAHSLHLSSQALLSNEGTTEWYTTIFQCNFLFKKYLLYLIPF